MIQTKYFEIFDILNTYQDLNLNIYFISFFTALGAFTFSAI